MKHVGWITVAAIIVIALGAAGICLIASRALHDASLPAEMVRR